MEASDSPIVVSIDHPRLEVDPAVLVRLLAHAAASEHRLIESVSVVLTDHETVLALNRSFLKHDYHTDVLSFNLEDDPGSGSVEGEIYVDLDTAAERCSEFGVGFEDEVYRYALHGLLHLIGYDDATPEGAAVMRGLEDEYLSGEVGEL